MEKIQLHKTNKIWTVLGQFPPKKIAPNPNPNPNPNPSRSPYRGEGGGGGGGVTFFGLIARTPI